MSRFRSRQGRLQRFVRAAARRCVRRPKTMIARWRAPVLTPPVALEALARSVYSVADETSALPPDTRTVVAAYAVAHAFPGASDVETLVVSGHARDRPAARRTPDRIGVEERSLTRTPPARPGGWEDGRHAAILEAGHER